MSNYNTNPPATPKSVLELLKDWKELIAFVALTLTGVFGGIFSKEHAGFQKASWILAIVFVAVGAYVVQRKQKRKLEQDRRDKLWAERAAQRKAGSAFRSLAPFEERDELPGKDRKVEARAIATRIVSDDFRFGVVCGDTGCGKTSMLRSEVTRVLRDSGFEVAYVRNPRRLESKTSEALPPTERLASELRALSRNYIKPTTGTVILDQFEEWFNEYQEPEQRVQIGKFIRKLAERSQRVRIVCAIRREFLIDFHDLSDELPQQLSTTNLFHIKNFTVEQAKDVINECATGDGLAPDEWFAETAAHDLAEGGQVRPPELQIVCTYLAVSGGLNTPRYRKAGGTAAILAHYIQDALSSSKAPDVGARLLRALCDFPARSKRKPRTLDELTDDVSNDSAASDKRLKNIVQELIHHFVLGRILWQDGKTYALMHDYLVDAVQIATGDASTKTEEANQLLRYYVAEERGSIPLKKLFFIRKFADRSHREEPVARTLIRKSVAAPILRWGTPALLGCAFLGLYLWTSSQVRWDQPKLLGQHREDGATGDVAVRWVKSRVFTKTKEYFRIWDAKRGGLLATFKDQAEATPYSSPSGRFFVLIPPKTGPARLLDSSTMEETRLSDDIAFVDFADSEDWIRWVERPSGSKWTTVIYSIRRKSVVQRLENGNIQLAPTTDRFVSYGGEGRRNVAELYELSTGRLIAELKDDDQTSIVSAAISGISSEVCLVSLVNNVMLVSLWSSSDGRPLDKYRFSTEESLSSFNAEFVSDGSDVVVSARNESKNPRVYGPVLILNTANRKLEPVGRVAAQQFRQADYAKGHLYFWEEKDGTGILDPSSTNPQIITDLKIDEDDYLKISEDTKRGIAWRKQVVELWDLGGRSLISKLPHSGVVKSVDFTVDDTAVVIREEGDVFSLFDAVDGAPVVKRFPRGGAGAVYYDRDCRRFHVWDESGQVIRYTEGRSYFGVFSPTKRCN